MQRHQPNHQGQGSRIRTDLRWFGRREWPIHRREQSLRTLRIRTSDGRKRWLLEPTGTAGRSVKECLERKHPTITAYWWSVVWLRAKRTWAIGPQLIRDAGLLLCAGLGSGMGGISLCDSIDWFDICWDCHSSHVFNQSSTSSNPSYSLTKWDYVWTSTCCTALRNSSYHSRVPFFVRGVRMLFNSCVAGDRSMLAFWRAVTLEHLVGAQIRAGQLWANTWMPRVSPHFLIERENLSL